MFLNPVLWEGQQYEKEDAKVMLLVFFSNFC